MKRPNFDNMTEKEQRQLGDYIDNSLSVQHTARLRRRKIAEAQNEIEAGEESEN